MWKLQGYELDSQFDWDALTARYRWLNDMKGVEQDPDWHAEGDVFTHTTMVVESLVALPDFDEQSEQDKHILIAAALCHDIEKRSTTMREMVNDRERVVSPRHAKYGESTVRTMLYKEIETPFEIREQIAKLVRHHGLPLWAIEKSDPRKEVIKASQMVNTKLLSMLARADVLGRTCDDQADVLERIDLFEELCKEYDCFGVPRTFPSSHARFSFLNKQGSHPDYEPYDDFKLNVFVACALPGAGKDTYIDKTYNLPVVSLDDIRREHGFSPTDKKHNGQVVQLGKEQTKVLLRKMESFVFNATNITADIRSKWISLFMQYGARVTIVYIEVPYKTLLKQNKNRDYVVPENVIDHLLYKLEMPNCSEAHDIELVIRK